MNCQTFGKTVVCLFSLILVSNVSEAWEIRLKGHVSGDIPVVRLEDVAEIIGVDARTRAAIGRIALAPGPTTFRSRILTTSWIREVLEGHGVELTECSFSGAVRSVVSGRADAPVATGNVFPERSMSFENVVATHSTVDPYVSPRRSSYVADAASVGVQAGTTGLPSVDGIRRAVERAVLERLSALNDASSRWDVEVVIGRRTSQQLPSSLRDMTLEGFDIPEAGRFSVMACFPTGHQIVRIPALVRVQKAIQVVVPVRRVERGQMVRASDVELRHVPQGNRRSSTVTRIEDVIGHQASHTIRSGEPLDTKDLKMPLLVKRGDIIDVIARCNGISVSKPVKATQDGALDDAIVVQGLDDKRTSFVARVVGVDRAEAFVSGSTVGARTQR